MRAVRARGDSNATGREGGKRGSARSIGRRAAEPRADWWISEEWAGQRSAPWEAGTGPLGAVGMSVRTPRRVPAAPAAPRALGTPVLAECPGNDDERERLQRRRSKATDLRLGSIDSPQGLVSPLTRYGRAR